MRVEILLRLYVEQLQRHFVCHAWSQPPDFLEYFEPHAALARAFFASNRLV